ncbi:MAG: rhodanese-like domain-containing protein [Campylobacterales bacterium]|nr:rhodanese-like domain-containing protein [Campylobacterales bacterium]
MKKYFLILVFIFYNINAYDTIKLPLIGVKVSHYSQPVTIEREVHPSCLNLTMNETTLWDGNFTTHTIPQACKKSFVTTQGVIQPLKLHKDIETFAELEVLEFILKKSSKKPEQYALVDSRPANWFNHSTIPSAINVAYDDLTIDNDFKEEYTDAYAKLGVIVKEGKFDFSHAKEIVLFCNGLWCTHSPRAIKTLLDIGYPAKKIKWYRGGISAWGSVGLTLIKKQ